MWIINLIYKLFKAIHIIYIAFLFTNIYLEKLEVSASFIIVSMSVLSLLSIIINGWYPVRLNNCLVEDHTLLFKYKRQPKIYIWVALLLGVIVIIVSIWFEGLLQVMLVMTGIHILANALIDHYYKRELILGVQNDTIFDLSQSIDIVKKKNINRYAKRDIDLLSDNVLLLYQDFRTIKIYNNDFHDSDDVINRIENDFLIPYNIPKTKNLRKQFRDYMSFL